MHLNKKYASIISLIIILFFLLLLLSRVEEPLEAYLQLPRCENTEVVITEELKSDIVIFANKHISQGTGEEYFENHYSFLSTSYSESNCIFEVRYIYRYEQFHTIASATVRVVSEKNFEIIDVNAFLIPVQVHVTQEEARQIAEDNDIDYDYFNLEANFKSQTFLYRFYRETIVEGRTAVFEIDAQSGEIAYLRRTSTAITIV